MAGPVIRDTSLLATSHLWPYEDRDVLLDIGRLYMDGTVARVPPEKVHILVVEDDPACREALGRVLQREGYDVSLTADFRGALEILESDQPIGVLLSDIVMPDRVNGIALSRMARLRRRDIKVVY